MRIIALLIGLLGLLAGALTMQELGRGGLAWPATIGERVRVPGGGLTVVEVIPEQMAPMNHNAYAALGMSMSAVVPDMTPEGYRSFAVVVQFDGRSAGGLPFALEQFVLTGQGMEPSAAFRSDLGGEVVPAGAAMRGVVIFRVPEGATGLMLRYGGSRPFLIDLEPGAGGHH